MEKNTTDKIKLKTVKRFVVAIVIVIVICIVILLIQKIFSSKADNFLEKNVVGEEGKVTTITKSTLEDVIKKSQLYTVEYPYNGSVAVCDDEGNVKYYVAYEGTVKAGIDVAQITVKELNEDTDSDTGTITIQLPQVQIENPVVNAGTMEYIFTNKKYNTETVAEDAYRHAEEDLAKRVSNDPDIKACAADSAKAAVRALIEPWVNQTNDKTYTVHVLEYEEAD